MIFMFSNLLNCFWSYCLCYCFSLERLNLHGNRITAVCKELEELVELTDLDLSYNLLATYPGSLYKLSKLRRLNLSPQPVPGYSGRNRQSGVAARAWGVGGGH